MSEAITALNGARFDGLVQVADAGVQGMITLRGDFAEISAIVTAETGCEMPAVQQITTSGTVSVGWMSPDELLVLCPYAEVDTTVAKVVVALESKHALVANVSDARAMFRLEGPAAREVLAKLSPADVSPDALAPGTLRRTRLAQIPAAFWFDKAGTAHVVCFRSVAQYAFDLLRTAAAPGSAVAFF